MSGLVIFSLIICMCTKGIWNPLAMLWDKSRYYCSYSEVQNETMGKYESDQTDLISDKLWTGAG